MNLTETVTVRTLKEWLKQIPKQYLDYPIVLESADGKNEICSSILIDKNSDFYNTPNIFLARSNSNLIENKKNEPTPLIIGIFCKCCDNFIIINHSYKEFCSKKCAMERNQEITKVANPKKVVKAHSIQLMFSLYYIKNLQNEKFEIAFTSILDAQEFVKEKLQFGKKYQTIHVYQAYIKN